jgi:type IV secretion system protein VirD4
LSQLAHIYGETGWQTFISNSGVIQYFGSRDKMTAEYFSSLCGVTTIEVHNFSWAVGQAIGYASSFTSSHGGGSSTTSNSTTDSWTRTNGTSEAQRQLAYPDELMVLHGAQQIVFVENLDPILAEKVFWYKDQALNQLGVNLQIPATETLRLEKVPS